MLEQPEHFLFFYWITSSQRSWCSYVASLLAVVGVVVAEDWDVDGDSLDGVVAERDDDDEVTGGEGI